MALNTTKLEIFCGTGGVGKTTLASSRAMHLSLQGKKVLLITIDPSKRLKQILNLTDGDAGEKHSVPVQSVIDKGEGQSFDAILMSPTHTFEQMHLKQERKGKNQILNILMRPNGGMNDIMAIIEVQKHIESNEYDVIILDTPPGKHFLDFLKSTQKIDRFFDKNFIEIFKYFGKKVTTNRLALTPKKVIGLVVSSGLKKLLKYLEVVTGKDFVEEFVDAIFILYTNKEKFLGALGFQKYIESNSNYELFLVASTEQQKLSEVLSIHQKSNIFAKEKTTIAVNKSNKKQIDAVDTSQLNIEEEEIIAYYRELENKVSAFSERYFGNFLIFEETFSPSPKKQVKHLVSEWK